MFDMSWLELAFCAAFALIVIGPKDLPAVFKAVANVVGKARKLTNEVKGSVAQLEREIDITQGKAKTSYTLDELLPESVRNLPKDFVPGSLQKEHHQQRRSATQNSLEASKSQPAQMNLDEASITVLEDREFQNDDVSR